MKLTIRRKLALFGVALVLINSILLSVVYFYQEQKTLKYAFRDRSTMIIKSVNFSLEKFTGRFEGTLKQLGNLPELKSDFTEDEKIKIENIMTNLRSAQEDILNIYFVSENNSLIISPKRFVKEGIDFKGRNWYINALKSDTFVWSDKYSDELTGRDVVTVSKAIYRDNKLQGVIAIDIEIDSFINYISNMTLGEGSYFIIADSNNTIISHPDKSLIGNKLKLDKLTDSGRDNNERFLEYTYNGVKKYAAYSILKKNNWIIMGTMNVAQTYKEAEDIFITTFFIALVVVSITALFARYLGMNITKDLSKLVEKISKINRGEENFNDFDAKSEETSIIATEVGQITTKVGAIVEAVSDAIWEYDVVNDKLFISKKFIEISGYDFTDRTKGMDSILHLFNANDVERLVFDYKNLIYLKQETDKREVRFRRLDGEYIWLNISVIVGERTDRKATMLYGAITDITEKKMRDAEVYQLAFYDSLTGLPNRKRLLEQFRFYIEKSKENNTSVAMILLNIDDFTKVNNTLGARVGDKYLKEVVNRLKALNREKNYYIARVGGDDFAILIDNLTNKERVQAFGEELLRGFKKPLLLDGKLVASSITLGISIYPEDGEDEEKIFRNADIAMVSASDIAGKKYRFFEQDMYNSFMRRLEIENCLRSADYNSEFKVFYQPQIDVKTHAVRGFEALIRWNSPILGFVSPGEFIPISEEIGVIVPLGKWLIYRIFDDILKMKELGINFGRISINISAVQLMDAEFGIFIEEAISRFNINYDDIELEITETSVINNIKYSQKMLNSLKEKGLKIVLDDFGTGYSSLSYLKNLPIEVLKIDKSFIDNIEYEGENRALISGIIGIAHELELEVVAEGVEVEGQVEILKDMECDSIQGYFFSKPIPFESIMTLDFGKKPQSPGEIS